MRDGDVIRLCADRGELSTTADLTAREPAATPAGQSGTGRELFAMFRLGADEAERGGSAMLAMGEL
ncbi:phosphogluconate dehydratase [compost metagenome]